MGWRERALPAAVVVLAALATGGCEILRHAQQTAERLSGEHTAFGTATRERVESDADGRTWELMVESTDAANWRQADRAMFDQLAHSCVDGEPYELLSTEPDWTDREREHAAGTVFRRKIRCRAPLPFEVAFPRGQEGDLAHRSMLAIAQGETVDDRRHRLLYAFYSGATTKYESLHATLGREIAEVSSACPGGRITVHDLVVGDTRDPPAHAYPTGIVTILLDVTCADGSIVETPRMLPGISGFLRLASD